MSVINRSMEKVELQEKIDIRTPTGVSKAEWRRVRDIDVALYSIDDRINTNSVRFNSSTHTGLTREKEIKEGKCRLTKKGLIYEVLSAKIEGKFTQLYLKAVDTNV